MKLFPRFSTRSKVIVSTVLALAAVAVIAIPTSTHAALGGDRQTKEYVQGMSGFDHVQFNSFTNVPTIGDERQFLSGKLDGANTPYYTSLSNAQNGDTLEMQVYVHNNADSSLNAGGTGVAKNTKVKVVLPTNLATSQSAQAFISADNAAPQTIEDDMDIAGNSAFGLQFVPGSATIKTNYQNVALSDDIAKNGVTIGSNDLSGNFNGCFDYVALITFKVKVSAPQYTVLKQVRMNGTTAWDKKVTAKPGDKVDFALTFHNTGGTQLNNVVLGDRLPVGLTYVPNSTMWDSGLTGNKWTAVTNDNWMTAGGLNVGSYAADATAYIKFTATVDDASKLQCGLNQITNFGFAKPENQTTIQDSAEVDVTKTCDTSTPTPTPTPAQTQKYTCDLLDIDKNDTTKTVTIKTFNAPASGGAKFKTVDIDWGENGSTVLSTNTAVGQTHTYTGNGPFTIRATAHFSTNANNDNDVTATSASCEKQVSFTAAAAATTPTPQGPTQLVNTGAGDVFGLFAAVTVAGAMFHRLFLSRRMAR